MQIHKVYQAALEGKPVAPLRFAIFIDPEKTPAELFASLPTGDVWMDANMSSVFEYVYNCKHVRTIAIQFSAPVFFCFAY